MVPTVLRYVPVRHFSTETAMRVQSQAVTRLFLPTTGNVRLLRSLEAVFSQSRRLLLSPRSLFAFPWLNSAVCRLCGMPQGTQSRCRKPTNRNGGSKLGSRRPWQACRSCSDEARKKAMGQGRSGKPPPNVLESLDKGRRKTPLCQLEANTPP
jgi:hypothetical protein